MIISVSCCVPVQVQIRFSFTLQDVVLEEKVGDSKGYLGAKYVWLLAL